MKFLAVVLTLSVGLAQVGCGGSSKRANSPDDENNEEVVAEEAPSEEAEQAADSEEQSDEEKEQAASRPAKKRPVKKRRRYVEAPPPPEPPPVVRKPPPPPPVEPAAEEPLPAPAYVSDEAEPPGEDALEAEARRRCHWKNVPPYRPEWANTLTPPLARQRKLTSKPVCPYGTPPAVLRVARQIAVQQTKLKR